MAGGVNNVGSGGGVPMNQASQASQQDQQISQLQTQGKPDGAVDMGSLPGLGHLGGGEQPGQHPDALLYDYSQPTAPGIQEKGASDLGIIDASELGTDVMENVDGKEKELKGVDDDDEKEPESIPQGDYESKHLEDPDYLDTENFVNDAVSLEDLDSLGDDLGSTVDEEVVLGKPKAEPKALDAHGVDEDNIDSILDFLDSEGESTLDVGAEGLGSLNEEFGLNLTEPTTETEPEPLDLSTMEATESSPWDEALTGLRDEGYFDNFNIEGAQVDGSELHNETVSTEEMEALASELDAPQEKPEAAPSDDLRGGAIGEILEDSELSRSSSVGEIKTMEDARKAHEQGKLGDMGLFNFWKSQGKQSTPKEKAAEAEFIKQRDYNNSPENLKMKPEKSLMKRAGEQLTSFANSIKEAMSKVGDFFSGLKDRAVALFSGEGKKRDAVLSQAARESFLKAHPDYNLGGELRPGEDLPGVKFKVVKQSDLTDEDRKLGHIPKDDKAMGPKERPIRDKTIEKIDAARAKLAQQQQAIKEQDEKAKKMRLKAFEQSQYAAKEAYGIQSERAANLIKLAEKNRPKWEKATKELGEAKDKYRMAKEGSSAKERYAKQISLLAQRTHLYQSQAKEASLAQQRTFKESQRLLNETLAFRKKIGL